MSSRRGDHRAFTLCVLIASLSPALGPKVALSAPPAASADKRNNAGDHFRRGVALYKERDFVAALVEFRRAYELSPNYRVLYDIGQSLFQLQRYADAIPVFESYLTQGGAQISAVRRASVEGDLRTLRSRVGHVEVTVNVDGAEVRVDDQTVGTSPLPKPVLVSVGSRRITVAKAGRVSLEKFVDVSAGDQASVSFVFPDAPSAPVAQVPETSLPPQKAPEETPSTPGNGAEAEHAAHAEPEPSSSTPLWVAWSTTAVLGAGTAVTGALVLGAKSTLSNQLAAFPGNPDTIEADRRRARTLATTTDILLAATAVSLAISVYVTLTHHRERAPDAAAVKVGFGIGGLQIRGDY
jgi:hypothetical protein